MGLLIEDGGNIKSQIGNNLTKVLSKIALTAEKMVKVLDIKI